MEEESEQNGGQIEGSYQGKSFGGYLKSNNDLN